MGWCRNPGNEDASSAFSAWSSVVPGFALQLLPRLLFLLTNCLAIDPRSGADGRGELRGDSWGTRVEVSRGADGGSREAEK